MAPNERFQCEFLNERFEVYFFLYYIGYVLVWRLNTEYITAKYIHSMTIDHNGEKLDPQPYDFNLSTTDVTGYVIPRLPVDVGKSFCLENGTEPLEVPIQVTHDVMKGAERQVLKVYTALLVPSLVVTILFGYFSDFTGKRKFMLSTSSFSNSLYALVIVFDYYMGDTSTITNLLIGSVFAGLFGNWAAATVALTTYVADVTKPRERFKRMAVVILLLKITYAVFEGPVVYWIRTKGFQQPIWFTFTMTSFSYSIIVQVMDESQATNRDYRNISLSGIIHYVKEIKFKSLFDRYFNVLAVSYSFFVFISDGYFMRIIYTTFSVTVCDLNDNPFYFLHYIAFHAMGCFGMILGVTPVSKVLPDIPLALCGMVSLAAGLVFLPFCDDEWMYYIAFALMFLHMIPYTVYLALSSKHTDSENQAIALTTLYCCGGISKLLAVIVNHFTFHEVPENPNLNDALLWFHAALLIVPAACLIALWVITNQQKKKVVANGYHVHADQHSITPPESEHSANWDNKRLSYSA